GALGQLLQVERLPDEGLRAAGRRLRFRLLVDLATEHDDRDRPRAPALLDLPQRLPAVDLRHHHVEEDQVRLRLLDRGEALVGAAGLAYRVALQLEVDADELPDAPGVVDGQDERAGARGAARPGARAEGLRTRP